MLGKCVAALRGTFLRRVSRETRFSCLDENMLYEKKKILVRRIVWGILLAIGIVVPVILALQPVEEATLINDKGYVTEYYEFTDMTDCEIEVTFDREVSSADIVVAFYDGNGNFLAREEGYFTGYDNELSASFFIDGQVDSYEIVSCELSVSSNYYDNFIWYFIIYIFDVFAFAFFVCALLLSCKVYEYDGKMILVYAGYYHHYLKADGVKMDEHNTLFSFTAIPLSCTLDDGTVLSATISMTNRISLKINDRLYTNYAKGV